MPRIAEINVYPIKSCGPVPCTGRRVGERGLDRDRRYMLVDAEGRFLSQRRHPRLALVRVTDDGEGGLRVDAPGRPTLRLPGDWPGGAEVKVRVHRDRVDAVAVDDRVGDWFAAFLGFPCRVVHMAEHQHRAVPNHVAAFDDEVGFADAAPLLLTSEASLEALNARLSAPVSMRRFRPNLVVEGADAFAEDGWRRLRIGEAELDVAWPSTRCVMVTVDPDTGVKDAGGEPLKTLRLFRGGPGGATFGQNVIPRRLGTVQVGDEVELR